MLTLAALTVAGWIGSRDLRASLFGAAFGLLGVGALFVYAMRGEGDVAAILGYREDEPQRSIHLTSAYVSLYAVLLYCVVALVVVRARGGKGWEYVGVTMVLSLGYFVALAVVRRLR